MNSFQKRLLDELERNNITQKELATKTGITPATISRYVTGQRKPTAENALNIANVLGVSADYLFGSTNKNQTHNATDFTPDLSEEQILTMAAHKVGHNGPLSDIDMSMIRKAIKIALDK